MEKKPELLAPAGTMEAVRAAVQSGATAVYMGFGTFNARRSAKNFTRGEMAEAIAYCRARGVKTNITVNIVVLDREFPAVLADVRFLNDAGADALIVQDLGLARRIRMCAPALELHASTQMTVHTLDGARLAASLGFSRVVLSRECTLEQIRDITANCGVETEAFVHGALCMCYSGQCYMSAMIGQRSGNRGLCAQPCRLPYTYEDGGKQQYPLSLKDLCLAGWLVPLAEAGVSSLKIEGRMKRPEYTAIATAIYAQLLHERRKPTAGEIEILRQIFSRDGFTDGYLTGKKGSAMFGTKTDVPMDVVKPLYDEAGRRFAEGKEAPLVPITVHCIIGAEGIALTVRDGQGSSVCVHDTEAVEAAHSRAASAEQIEKNLRKTGGTPFDVHALSIDLADGLLVPAARINALRRDALKQLLDLRLQPPVRPWADRQPVRAALAPRAFQGYTVEVRQLAQITQEMRRHPPETIYVPLSVLAAERAQTEALIAEGLRIAAVLPRIYSDEEQPEIVRMLEMVQDCGVQAAVAGTVGHIETIRACGLTVYGDFGLNACNSDTLEALADCAVQRQTLSFELRFAQLRDLYKPMDTELIVYGYLPLMLFENCAIARKNGKDSCKVRRAGHGLCKNGITHLTDRTGKRFALLPEHGCRNTLLNSQPLYIGDKPAEYRQLGIPYARLRFTTEEPARCGEIYLAHVRETIPAFPEGKTRGLYHRGVE